MAKRLVAVLAVLALFGAACGGDSSGPDTAAFKRVDPQVCEKLPASVPGITVLGQRIESVSDVKVCVEADTGLGGVPAVKDQPQCGNPCFTVEIAEFDVSADVSVMISYKRDGAERKVIDYDPEPIATGPDTGRLCVVGVGSPDPCAERITTPKDLTVAAAKRKLQLGWQASVDTGGAPLAGYEIWRSDSGAEGTFYYWGNSSETSFVDSGLPKGVQHWYFVVAFDADGNHSAASNIVSGTAK